MKVNPQSAPLRVATTCLALALVVPLAGICASPSARPADANNDQGARDALPVILKRLHAEPDPVICRDLAALGPAAWRVGPELVALLAHDDAEVRVAAARALGYIGYGEAQGPLRRLLQDPYDWRLVYAASQSLGRLGVADAATDLATIAKSHWYPRVRAAAHEALAVVRGQARYPSRPADFTFAQEFFDYLRPSEGAALTTASREQPRLVPGADELSEKELQALWQQATSHVLQGLPGYRGDVPPSCGLRVSGGYLIGIDQGEFGGLLLSLPLGQAPLPLLRKNIVGMHRLPAGIVAVAGLAHLGIDRGYVFLVSPSKGAGYRATLWRTLPGAPRRSGLLADGALFVACTGGEVVIDADGKIRLLDSAGRR